MVEFANKRTIFPIQPSSWIAIYFFQSWGSSNNMTRRERWKFICFQYIFTLGSRFSSVGLERPSSIFTLLLNQTNELRSTCAANCMRKLLKLKESSSLSLLHRLCLVLSFLFSLRGQIIGCCWPDWHTCSWFLHEWWQLTWTQLNLSAFKPPNRPMQPPIFSRFFTCIQGCRNAETYSGCLMVKTWLNHWATIRHSHLCMKATSEPTKTWSCWM